MDEKLYDVQYLQAHTENFDSLKEHLSTAAEIGSRHLRHRGRYDPQGRAGLRPSRTCHDPWGQGISQPDVHGTDNARCLIALSLMCGQVGRPGTGLHPLRGQNNVQGASDAGLIPMFYPDYADVTSEGVHRKYEELWDAPLSKKSGLTVVEVINAANAGEIRGMYIQGENPAMSDPDLDHARAGIAKLEHLVVQDIFLTETAMMADVVLPASAWPEKNGYGYQH